MDIKIYLNSRIKALRVELENAKTQYKATKNDYWRDRSNEIIGRLCEIEIMLHTIVREEKKASK